MEKKRCYYEILNVERNATEEEIKRSYRQLALTKHPDKNPQRTEQANIEFRLLQEAYDVLSDPKERCWYDRHREAILRGNQRDQIVDEGIDVGPFFSSYCYDGFDHSENGFYSVYNKLFKQIADEDKPFRSDDDEEPPEFGKSDSPYNLVYKFYSFWQSYCTKKSFDWLDKYNVIDAPNRRVARLIEKENKKERDSAKKKRNEEIRQLVEFVRKRDKRVIEQRKKMEAKANENKRKSELLRLKNIEERNKLLENYKESEWTSMATLESELQQIENELDGQQNTQLNEEEDDEQFESLYCVACDKTFKSDKAFENHEKSKKHKLNVAQLKEVLEEEMKVLDD